jgi:hypothetical protein
MQLAHSEGVKGGEEPWKSILTIPPLPAKLWLGHSVHTLQFWVLTDVSHFPVIVVANEIVKGTDLSMPLNIQHWLSVLSGHKVYHGLTLDLHACSTHSRLDSHLWERHCFLDPQSTNLLDSPVGFPWLQDNVLLITKAWKEDFFFPAPWFFP